MDVEQLTKIANWILTLPKEDQFKLSPLDFIKLADMLEAYHEYKLDNSQP